MKLPLHIARNLMALCEPDCKIPVSAMKHPIVTKMLEDGVLEKMQLSKSKAVLVLKNAGMMAAYLQNNFGIYALTEYIAGLENPQLSRSDAVAISGDSKLKAIRTFKGFVVNSFEPVSAFINGRPLMIHPPAGSFVYISDYEHFKIDDNIIVVGVENAENFAKVRQQRYLFEDMKVLFVCRYPQNNDLLKWLIRIPNHYLHFGDLDFAGLSIYLSEFKACLGTRAALLLPENTEELLIKYGSRALFNKQFQMNKTYHDPQHEKPVQDLYHLILRYKKVLEQEIFIQ